MKKKKRRNFACVMNITRNVIRLRLYSHLWYVPRTVHLLQDSSPPPSASNVWRTFILQKRNSNFDFHFHFPLTWRSDFWIKCSGSALHTARISLSEFLAFNICSIKCTVGKFLRFYSLSVSSTNAFSEASIFLVCFSFSFARWVFVMLTI